MADKIFNNVRLALKVDTLENWGKSELILKKGEVAICTTAATAGTGLTEPVTMIKIGDGTKTFSELGWNFYAKASDVLAACKSETALETFIGNVIAKSGIASDEAMTALAGRVDVAEGAITSLKGLVGDDKVADQIAAAIAELKLGETYELQGVAQEYADGLNTAMDVRVKTVEGKAHEHANREELNKIATGDVEKWNAAEQNAKDYADGLDGAMDTRVKAIEAKFGEGEGNVESQIADAVAAEKELREAADTALDNKIKAITNDYLKAEDKTALQDQITSNDEDIAGLKSLVGDKKVSEAISEAVAAEALIARAAEEANAKAVQDLADGAVKANTDAIAKLNGDDKTEGSVDYKVAQEVAKILNDNDETDIDTLEEIAAWIKNDTAGVGALNKKVTDNETAIAKLNGDADTEGSVDKKIADAIAGENLAQYAKATDLDEAEAAIEALQGVVGKAAEDEEAATGLVKGVADNAAEIATLKGLVGDKKVSEAISGAIAEANLAQYALASDLDDAEGRIEALEGDRHAHTNKTVLDGIDVDKVAAWDAKVDSIAAGNGLKATREGNAVTIDFDDDIVFVFNCGGADVPAAE